MFSLESNCSCPPSECFVNLLLFVFCFWIIVCDFSKWPVVELLFYFVFFIWMIVHLLLFIHWWGILLIPGCWGPMGNMSTRGCWVKYSHTSSWDISQPMDQCLFFLGFWLWYVCLTLCYGRHFYCCCAFWHHVLALCNGHTLITFSCTFPLST